MHRMHFWTLASMFLCLRDLQLEVLLLTANQQNRGDITQHAICKFAKPKRVVAISGRPRRIAAGRHGRGSRGRHWLRQYPKHARDLLLVQPLGSSLRATMRPASAAGLTSPPSVGTCAIAISFVHGPFGHSSAAGSSCPDASSSTTSISIPT